MKYKVEESYRIMRESYLNRKYSKSKSLNLNCEAKDIFNRYVSLDRLSVGIGLPIISLIV